MVDELITIEQLERVKRLIEGGMSDIAIATLEAMIEGRQQRVEQFESEMWDNVPI